MSDRRLAREVIVQSLYEMQVGEIGMEQALRAQGASVQRAMNRIQLAEQLDNASPPQVILADYQLDDGDNGVDAVGEEMAARGLNISCIVISANDAPPTRAHAKSRGYRFLPKPVNEARLRAFILAITREAG